MGHSAFNSRPLRYVDAHMSDRFPGLVRRLRYGPPIVVVSGLPRSGTSMAMKMLEAGGPPSSPTTCARRRRRQPQRVLRGRARQGPGAGRQPGVAPGRARKGHQDHFVPAQGPPRQQLQGAVHGTGPGRGPWPPSRRCSITAAEDTATEDAQMREHYLEHLRHVKFMVGYRRHFDTLFVPYRGVLDQPRERPAHQPVPGVGSPTRPPWWKWEDPAPFTVTARLVRSGSIATATRLRGDGHGAPGDFPSTPAWRGRSCRNRTSALFC
jgi:hypothetical protein